MKALAAALAGLLLAGCAQNSQTVSVYDPVNHTAPHKHNAHMRTAVVTADGQLVFIDGARPLVSEEPMASTDMMLTDYVRNMSQHLVNSSHYVDGETPIGVASFVALDNYRSTNLFGMQIAESFVFEMQQHGFSVIDYKSTGFIRITPEGDFVYSRNVKELSKKLPIEYLLIGTYSPTKDGMLVNARIVGAQSKVVVASAQQLIPNEVFRATVPAPVKRDGVLLIEPRKQAKKMPEMMGERG